MTDIEKTAQQPTACFRELEMQHHTDHIFNVAGISPPSNYRIQISSNHQVTNSTANDDT